MGAPADRWADRWRNPSGTSHGTPLAQLSEQLVIAELTGSTGHVAGCDEGRGPVPSHAVAGGVRAALGLLHPGPDRTEQLDTAREPTGVRLKRGTGTTGVYGRRFRSRPHRASPSRERSAPARPEY